MKVRIHGDKRYEHIIIQLHQEIIHTSNISNLQVFNETVWKKYL